MDTYLVLASLKVSGGTQEAIRLGEELARTHVRAGIIALWRSPHPVDSSLEACHLSEWKTIGWRAPIQIPFLAGRFRRWLKARREPARFIFTHYATLPLLMLVPERHRFVFVQDLEWKFITNPLVANLLRSAILYCYGRAKLISANAYLTSALKEVGLQPAAEIPIWASSEFLACEEGDRDIDFVMVLRKGAHKRLDLYKRFVSLATREAQHRVAVISTEHDLIEDIGTDVALKLLRPSVAEMRSLYLRSKCFIHLSEHEGFGLPPLEAMAAGCVPVCRDSGGVRAFMSGATLAPLLLDRGSSVEEIYRCARALLRDPTRLYQLREECRKVFVRGLSVAARRGEHLCLLFDEEKNRASRKEAGNE